MASIPEPDALTPEQWARLVAAVFGPRVRLPQRRLIRLQAPQALLRPRPG